MPYWSLCGHHFLPFRGTVSVGYIAQEKVALRVNGGVVSSPIDGVESVELISKARETAQRASVESPGQVIGF